MQNVRTKSLPLKARKDYRNLTKRQIVQYRRDRRIIARIQGRLLGKSAAWYQQMMSMLSARVINPQNGLMFSMP